MIEFPAVPASELNTIILAFGVPMLAWIGRKLIRAVEALTITVSTLSTVLLGTEGQGGLVRRVEGVARQGHDSANKITALEGDVGELKEERRQRER